METVASQWVEISSDEADMVTILTVAILRTGLQTFVQHGVGRLVPSQRLFGQVLVGLRQTFHLSKTSVESHGRVSGVLGHVQVSCPPQLLLNHQSLLQQLQRERERNKKTDKLTTDTRDNVCFNLHSDIINPLILELFQPSVVNFNCRDFGIALKRRARNLFFISR